MYIYCIHNSCFFHYHSLHKFLHILQLLHYYQYKGFHTSNSVDDNTHWYELSCEVHSLLFRSEMPINESTFLSCNTVHSNMINHDGRNVLSVLQEQWMKIPSLCDLLYILLKKMKWGIPVHSYSKNVQTRIRISDLVSHLIRLAHVSQNKVI